MIFRKLLLIINIIFVNVAYGSEPIVNLDQHAIIPQPRSVIGKGGTFQIDNKTKIVVDGNEERIDYAVGFFQQLIKRSTGFTLQRSSDKRARNNVIYFKIDASSGIPVDGYTLDIDDNHINIIASTSSGLFNGVQTLRQIMPSDIERGKTSGKKKWVIPTGTIEDAPEYGYRGAMLDVARHFFSVEDVKHFIDQIAKYKINKLHLHLSDDQGWRIEIKSWPLLTTVGGATAVGGGKGGFYTQEEYKDIVAYAQTRFITIIPEIDMPGHTNSALAAYGILNPGITVPEDGIQKVDRRAMGIKDDEDATHLYTGMKVGFSTLDTKKDITYQFVEDVIRELSAITPGPYIHIGGDESHVTNMEDYIPFIERAQHIVGKFGKKTIGWDEVAHARLEPSSVAQYWAKSENARKAADQGAQILMSPSTNAYLDMQYDTTTQLGLHWAAYIEIDDAYNWEPTTLVEGISKEQIIGVEAPLWTETITNREELEYMVFPRITAIAEIGWTKTSLRNWESYKTRLIQHTKRWDIMGINYYKSPRLQ
ncbi:beta-N-acetylhexosaminidase [Anditalea andensis]|uniref:beta-N-acetylhexosaminidase n=1 Tax=Anditalea andensis TaxID=1048983 RepID=A0A074KVT8_9BACT|nr:beta-N-acetylhexosaminidase [Anditalea andensis]KEO74086.1 beta-N-acetylhexosaminidase [Anditalea andensis]